MSIDGFIVIDAGTGAISITTKIENQGGISAKSTGNLKLTVEEYIEHGEVEEGCVVEGKHLVFLADVFGTVISDGGNIKLNSRLSGGHAKSVGGNIGVKGKTLNATLEAWDGNVRVEFVENSLVLARSGFSIAPRLRLNKKLLNDFIWSLGEFNAGWLFAISRF